MCLTLRRKHSNVPEETSLKVDGYRKPWRVIVAGSYQIRYVPYISYVSGFLASLFDSNITGLLHLFNHVYLYEMTTVTVSLNKFGQKTTHCSRWCKQDGKNRSSAVSAV